MFNSITYFFFDQEYTLIRTLYSNLYLDHQIIGVIQLVNIHIASELVQIKDNIEY